MSAVTSSLSTDQQKKLLSLFSHVRLHLLYKASIHGFTAAAFHARCDKQGPTITVAYNAAGFLFGGYTSKDYTQSKQAVHDAAAFLYSISAERDKPLRVACVQGQPAFIDEVTGPHFGALVFLHGNQPAVQINPGTSFNFEAAEMHGNDLVLTEFELYRVEGGLKKKNKITIFKEVSTNKVAFFFFLRVNKGSLVSLYLIENLFIVKLAMNGVGFYLISCFCLHLDLGDFLPKPWRNIQWTSEYVALTCI